MSFVSLNTCALRALLSIITAKNKNKNKNTQNIIKNMLRYLINCGVVWTTVINNGAISHLNDATDLYFYLK